MSTQDNRFMEFRIGEQLFAIPLLTVKEVIPKPEIRSVPSMPGHFEGMMNLRGQILGVFNLRKKLGVKNDNEKNKLPEVIVVIEEGGVSVGMIVDEVTRVLYSDSEKMKAAPLKEEDPAKKYVKGIIQQGDDIVLWIAVNKLFEIEKLQSIREAA